MALLVNDVHFGTVVSGYSFPITCTPNGAGNPVNLLSIVCVWSLGPAPSSVVFSGIGGQFTFIRNISLGPYTVSFWGAFGLPYQSGTYVTVTFPSAVNLAIGMCQTYQNAYQGALPNVIYSNYGANIESISVNAPDPDNLSILTGIVFGVKVQYFGWPTVPDAISTWENYGGPEGPYFNGSFFNVGSPTAPDIITLNYGTSTVLGICEIVIEEYGWVAPIPIPVPIVCPYFEGGFARKMVNTLSDLWAINGQAVSIVQDGVVSVDSGQIVNNGSITLTNKGAVIHVGLPYDGTVQLLPLGGDGQTVNQGKERKIYDIVLRLYQSLGGTFGADTDVMYPLPIPAVTQPANAIVNPLYTGDIHGVGFESKWDQYCMPVLRKNDPTPFTLLAEIIRSEISEDK